MNVVVERTWCEAVWQGEGSGFWTFDDSALRAKDTRHPSLRQNLGVFTENDGQGEWRG